MNETQKRQDQRVDRARERDLVQRCLRGELGAYEEFVSLVYDQLVGFAVKLTRVSRCLSTNDVDDLVDTAIRAAVRPEALEKWRATEPLIRFALRFLMKKFETLVETREAQKGHKIGPSTVESLGDLAEELPDENYSVEETAQQQIRRERYEATYERLQDAFKLSSEEIVALRLVRGLGFTPDQIKKWLPERIDQVAHLSEEEAKALRELQRRSGSDIEDVARATESKVRERVIRHYVIREARRLGISPLEVISNSLQSDRERFIVRLRLLERHDFEPIGNAFPRVFQEDVDSSDVETLYFACLERVMHSSGFKEMLEVILSEVK